MGPLEFDVYLLGKALDGTVRNEVSELFSALVPSLTVSIAEPAHRLARCPTALGARPTPSRLPTTRPLFHTFSISR